MRFSKCAAIVAILILALTQRPMMAATAQLSMLHAQGKQIVDAQGREVALRGINLGGWLVEEPWMEPFVVDPPAGSPYPKNQDHVSIWGTARQRFGASGMDRIRTTFRENWITQADFDRMHADGMNCIRLPFLASLVSEPNGYHWLDQAIQWAGQRNMYVVLDMHGVPGSQSDQDHTGRAGTPTFFTDPKMVPETCAIWRQIALRYRDNPVVAGYDLINEPMASPTSDTLYVVYDRLYNAVRSADPNHIIIMEDGYTGIQWMPFLAPTGWTNVVYSSHHYDFNAKSATEQQNAVTGMISSVQKEMDRRNIPWYVGEFAFEPNGTPEILRSSLEAMGQSGIAATMWTYKTYWNGPGHLSLWGLYSNTKPIEPMNFFTDSEQTLIRKCALYRTENMQENTGAAQAFRAVH